MKLCFLANGGSIHTQKWVNYFVDKGYEVSLISSTPYKYKSLKFHLLKTYTNNRYLNFLGYCLQIKKIIKKIKPDIVHSHYATTSGFLGALSGFHPLVVSVWGSDVLVEPKKSKLLNLMALHALRKADTITTTAKFMGDCLHQNFNLPKNKIIRIPWGINLNIFHCNYKKEVECIRQKLKIDKHTKVILSNRTLYPPYNIHRIIESIPYVIKEHKKVVFIFIKGPGSSKYERILKSKAKKLGVFGKTRFISKLLTPREMAIWLNMADMFISIIETDQFACSIMEGMACGAIPIVSNIKVYKQYLENGKNAFFVNSDKPKEIAKKIIYCIKHPELKEKFYKINRKIIEKNEDWNKNAGKMEKLYENLIK